MTFNALDYWGKLAIKQTEEIRKLKEQIVHWAIMLSSPDFKDTDAGVVFEEMDKLLNAELTLLTGEKNNGTKT